MAGPRLPAVELQEQGHQLLVGVVAGGEKVSPAGFSPQPGAQLLDEANGGLGMPAGLRKGSQVPLGAAQSNPGVDLAVGISTLGQQPRGLAQTPAGAFHVAGFQIEPAEIGEDVPLPEPAPRGAAHGESLLIGGGGFAKTAEGPQGGAAAGPGAQRGGGGGSGARR